MTNLQIENEILDLIDNSGDYSRGDLQGVVEALVYKINPFTPKELQYIKENFHELLKENPDEITYNWIERKAEAQLLSR